MSLTWCGFFLLIQLEGEICSRFEKGCSWVRNEGCPTFCSFCPCFCFREDVNGLWRVCGGCGASIRSALRHGKRSSEDTYFSDFGDGACRRGEKCPHFLDMIVFECELFAKVFYCLQSYAFAHGLLFFDALRPLPYIWLALICEVQTPNTSPWSSDTGGCRRLFLMFDFAWLRAISIGVRGQTFM